MNQNICYILERNIGDAFLANISYRNKNKYKNVSDFFGFTFTKNSYNFFFKANKLRGFNNSFNFFLCPWEKKSIKYYIENLRSKEEKEIFNIDALIINGQLLNIYNEQKKEYIYKIVADPRVSLLNLELYMTTWFSLTLFLKFNIKIILWELYIIFNLKKKEWI